MLSIWRSTHAHCSLTFSLSVSPFSLSRPLSQSRFIFPFSLSLALSYLDSTSSFPLAAVPTIFLQFVYFIGKHRTEQRWRRQRRRQRRRQWWRQLRRRHQRQQRRFGSIQKKREKSSQLIFAANDWNWMGGGERCWGKMFRLKWSLLQSLPLSACQYQTSKILVNENRTPGVKDFLIMGKSFPRVFVMRTPTHAHTPPYTHMHTHTLSLTHAPVVIPFDVIFADFQIHSNENAGMFFFQKTEAKRQCSKRSCTFITASAMLISTSGNFIQDEQILK